jgi:glycosyltransferase involved in cell wall biosynthesis
MKSGKKQINLDNNISSNEVSELKSKINELNDEIVALRETVFKQRDEIHVMRNSRVLGRIIKIRDTIGNPYNLPKRSINKVRRTVAGYIPDAVRLPLMKNLRKTRDISKQKIKQHFSKKTVTVTVSNVQWRRATPLVSVVIPYYNRADTIDETLQSLDKQTFKNIEIIIVDDHSSDKKSKAKLDQLHGVKIIHHETNQGVAMARNHGIEAAKGKYIICLDSDDILEPTFIEKATLTLETNPDVSLVSTYQDMFGVINELFEKPEYNAVRLIEDNMVITAAQFRREAWEQSGGYKPDIGYEDWEFWLTLAENGHWGKQIPEPLFRYRTSMQSRYVDDKDIHWNNLKIIRGLHAGYKKRIRTLQSLRNSERHVVDVESALINLKNDTDYNLLANKPNVLIAMPWMTFGGAETLIYNFCRQTKESYNISFITGLKSENQWEYKFREISENVYHLPNLFEDKELYVEFVSNYIKTRGIEILHIIHTDFLFKMLPVLKQQHPKLKVIVTMFNDRVPTYVKGVIDKQLYIDAVTSDNQKTATSFKEKLEKNANLKVIPNGIDCDEDFNPLLFDRDKQREELMLEKDDLAVFFVGRLSEEKNPDVFVEAAHSVLLKNKNVKFFVIGDGPMRHDIEKQIKNTHTDKVSYLGYQSEIAQYLSAADVFVLPSSIEGFPLSILEAMAMKVVVVASSVGGVPDVVAPESNGYLVEPGSVGEIAKAITELNNDRAKLKRMKNDCRETIEKTYSHTQLGRNYKNLYKDILG